MLFRLKKKNSIVAFTPLLFNKCSNALQKETEILPLQVSLSQAMRRITIIIIIAN